MPALILLVFPSSISAGNSHLLIAQPLRLSPTLLKGSSKYWLAMWK